MVFFSNEWCKECIKWSQFFCRARREGAMRWVMRMRSVRENKETVNNHTARWSKLLFGCVKYRKKTKTCSFSSPASRKKKNYMLKNEAIAPQLCKIIWSLSDRWLNPRACPPQAMYMIIRFTNSEIVNIPHASLSHSLTILSSLFFFNLWTKIKTTRQTRVNVCDCSVVDEQFAADLISVYSFLSKIRIQICCLFTAQPTGATTTAATAFTLCVASEHIFITNWILMRIITQCLVVCLDLMHRRHWWWTKHMQFRQILFIKLMLIIMFWCSPLAAILSHYMHSVDAANTKNGRTP